MERYATKHSAALFRTQPLIDTHIATTTLPTTAALLTITGQYDRAFSPANLRNTSQLDVGIIDNTELWFTCIFHHQIFIRINKPTH